MSIAYRWSGAFGLKRPQDSESDHVFGWRGSGTQSSLLETFDGMFRVIGTDRIPYPVSDFEQGRCRDHENMDLFFKRE